MAETSRSADLRGAALMSASMAGFSLNDAIIKFLSARLDLFQIIFVRGLFAAIMMVIFCAWAGELRTRLQPADMRVIGWRLVGEIGGTICFLSALVNMPLANATAILQAMPLAVTLGAAWWLREPVGRDRWLAIVIGFAAVLLIVRPGADGFDRQSLWAVASIGFFVLRDLSTRRLSPAVPSRFVSLLTTLVIATMGGLVGLFRPWPPLDAGAGIGLLAAAVFVIVGYLCGVMAMRSGRIAFVSPFRYSILIWSVLLGAALFDHWPGWQTWLGALILVITGMHTLRR
ncbi:MAG: DMT family transporter [Burkholderiaceae bacterium]